MFLGNRFFLKSYSFFSHRCFDVSCTIGEQGFFIQFDSIKRSYCMGERGNS